MQIFLFLFHFPSSTMTLGAFIAGANNPFLMSLSLIVQGITHKDIVVCSNLPFQPFLLSLTPWYLRH